MTTTQTSFDVVSIRDMIPFIIDCLGRVDFGRAARTCKLMALICRAKARDKREDFRTIYEFPCGPDGVFCKDGEYKRHSEKFDNRKLDGPCWTEYASGSIYTLFNYNNGKKDGLNIWWYENGDVYIYAEYKDGLRHGVYRRYKRNGRLTIDQQYINGTLVTRRK